MAWLARVLNFAFLCRLFAIGLLACATAAGATEVQLRDRMQVTAAASSTEDGWTWLTLEPADALAALPADWQLLVDQVRFESIVVTAIPCSLLGLSVGFAGLWRRNGAISLLGLSTPLVSLAVFLWIFLKSWSPVEAQLPVSAALLGYEVFCLAVGALGAFSESRGRDLVGSPRPMPISRRM